MIDLYVIPIRQYFKELSFPVQKIHYLQGDYFFHTTANTKTNLVTKAFDLVSGLYDTSKCKLQLQHVYQPAELTENLCIAYRLIIQSDGVTADQYEIKNLPIYIKDHKGSTEITIPDLSEGSINFILGMDVVNSLHNSILNTVVARTHTKGFDNLLSFLPDPFDIKELSMIYAALLGRIPSLPRSLANSLLDEYEQGSRKEKDGTVVPRKVFGRDLIEEISEFDPEYKTLEEKRMAFKESFSDDFSKGGKKVKTLFRKKHKPSVSD